MSKYANSVVSDMISILNSDSHTKLFKKAEDAFGEEVILEDEPVTGGDSDSDIIALLDKEISDEDLLSTDSFGSDSDSDVKEDILEEVVDEDLSMPEALASMVIGLTKISAILDNYNLEAEAAKTLEVAKKVKKVMDEKKIKKDSKKEKKDFFESLKNKKSKK